MDMTERKRLMREFCETTNYDRTRNWRLDPRTDTDPDDEEEIVPIVKPFNYEPKTKRAE